MATFLVKKMAIIQGKVRENWGKKRGHDPSHYL